jgi:hypothetical protein
MRSTRVSDGVTFRENVREHAGAHWETVERLSQATGILAGSDSRRSRGIYCESCAFGLRWDFGDYPVREGRTSLANDFNDEAHRRDCPHWEAYVNHPEAFFHCRADRQTPSDPPPGFPPDHRCEQCGASASVTFRCLGRLVCFVCLSEVAKLTGGYPGLQSLISVRETDEKADGSQPRGKRGRGAGRCRTCKAAGTLIPIRNVGFCRPCAVSEIERLLES